MSPEQIHFVGGLCVGGLAKWLSSPPERLESALSHRTYFNTVDQSIRCTNASLFTFKEQNYYLWTCAGVMLDPLTAVGLASAIVQLVDFSSELVSETKELYHSTEGNSAQNEELQSVTEDLKELCKTLSSAQRRAPSVEPSTDELALLELSGSCKVVADELIAVLEKLRVKSAHEKWGSFKTALRGAMKKERIENIRARLDRIQSQLQIRLTSILR